MFKQIFRLTFITFVWKQYKRTIVSTLLLLAYFWLVNFMHAEYLAFAKFQSSSVDVGISFFIKWACLILGLIIFVVYHFYKTNKLSEKSNKAERVDKKNKALEPDPFTAIREKETLRTRSEIMLDKNSSQNKG